MKYKKGDEEAKAVKKTGEAVMGQMKSMIHLSDGDLKKIKDWQVGKSYKISLKVKQVSKTEDEGGVHAGFEIDKAEA